MTDTIHDSSGSAQDQTVFDQLLLHDRLSERLMYAALYYANLGMPVFPVVIITDKKGKTRKVPRIENWPNEATTNAKQIVDWWAPNGEFPGSMIGIVTGERSGWGVVDVDCKNGAKGFESLMKLADEIVPNRRSTEIAFGSLLPEERLTPAGLVRTMSGGLHLWYRLGEHRNVRNRMRVTGLPGIEFKATGTYVVAAPSDGYEWVRQLPIREDSGLDELLTDIPIIPTSLLNRLLVGDSDTDSNDSVTSSYDDDGREIKNINRGDGSRLLTAAISTLMTTPEGQGNNTVYNLCCDLYPYVTLGELSHAEVDRAIMAGIARWGADEDTIKATMRSAWKRTSDQRTIRYYDQVWESVLAPQGKTDHKDTATATVTDISSKRVVDEIDTSVPPVDSDVKVGADDIGLSPAEVIAMIPADIRADDSEYEKVIIAVKALNRQKIAKNIFDAMNSTSRSWVETDLGENDDDPVPDVLTMVNGKSLLYSGEMNMAWGLASAGKSWLAYLAIAEVVKRGQHAILLDYENGRQRIRSRLRALGLSQADVKKYVHVYLSEIGIVPIKRLPMALDEVGIVVTDSCTGALAAMDLDARSTGDVETFATRNVTPFTAAGAAVLILDHVTHDAEKHDRPINSVHKLNRVQGTGLQVESVVPFQPGSEGWSWIRLWKDNSGGVEQVRGENVGRLVIDARNPSWVNVRIDTDTKSLAVMSQVSGVSDDRVEKLVAQLDEAGVERGLSVVKTREAMNARGITAGQQVVRMAVSERKKTS